MKHTKVVILGCGVMGRKIAEGLSNKKNFSIVGALDIHPDLIGEDLGSLMDKPQKWGVTIRKDADFLLSNTEADAVVISTTSHLKQVFSPIAQCANARLNVISTCEELSFPWRREPELAQSIDELAKEKGVTVVGTGINPGFLMDTLPLILTAPCLEVHSVQVIRMMDSSKRRVPFQIKIGTGLTEKVFREKINNRIITGHVGLLESIDMIGAGLGWEIDQAVEFPPEPVIADKDTDTGIGRVNPGDVIGLKSTAYAQKNDKKVIQLEFNANAGVKEEYDEIIITGSPNIRQKIMGGVHGDIGTVAVAINTIPRAVEAPAGLVVMKDLPPVLAVL